MIRELEHVSSKFLITAAEKADSGRYECQASNPFGKSYYHIQLQIWGKGCGKGQSREFSGKAL